MPSTRANTDTDPRGSELLRLEALSVSFTTRAGVVSAVRGLSLSVARGECLGIVGESGAGKSQAFLAVMGLLPGNAAVSGSARFAGTQLLGMPGGALDRIRGARIGMVFQDPMGALTPHLTVGEQIAEVLRRHRGASRTAAAAGARALLARVQVNDPARRARQYPHELSGGMRQRVGIALALGTEPQLLIADEPTTALDVTIQAQILSLLGELKRSRDMALILITHDLGAVAGLADRVTVMKDGALVEEGEAVRILTRPEAPYTRTLLGAAGSLGGAAPAQSSPDSWRDTRGADAAREPAALALDALSVRFPVRQRWLGPVPQLQALTDIDVTLAPGESLGIVGESGSGKSTLARVALALLKPTAGRIVWTGSEIQSLPAATLRPLRRGLQMVFQDPLTSLDPRMSVAQIVAEPLTVHAPQLTRDERERAVLAALGHVALPATLSSRYPHELSGGQCQRVGIARAMVLKPAVLVCDEPVSALDVPTQAQIVALLSRLQRESAMSLVFISHNLQLVQQLCTRVLVLYLGRRMELLPAADLAAGARHPYTRALLASIPSTDPGVQRERLQSPPPGEPPSPLSPPSGCVYRTRCPYALSVCAARVPAWESIARGHEVACHRQRELA